MGTKQPINFRKLLVSRCQQEFERDYLQGLDKPKYEADLEEAGNDEAKRKTIQVIKLQDCLVPRPGLDRII